MAEMGYISSGLLAADAVIHAGGCLLGGCLVISDGTNAVNLVLHDHATAASGTKVAEIDIAASAAAGSGPHILWFGGRGVQCVNGIYANITQAAGTLKFYVWYR